MLVSIIRRRIPENVDLPGNLHPVLKRIFAARNIRSARELDYSLQCLLPFHSLRGIEQAVNLLADVVKNNRRILIIADFDADGATSCALAVRGLQSIGAEDVHYLVPNRFEFGYGLSPEIVEVAAQLQPDLLVTVDNGISSIDGVGLARSKKIDVLITDHHLPGEKLPHANAIVNPNQTGDPFPSKYLAGVGVIFYILMALRAYLREQHWFAEKNIPEPNLAEFLDLVALGTVADVVPLDHNNRILVAQGLARIRAGKCCDGIKALFKVANRSLYNITSQDLGFVIGPRLNAAGRLTDMTLGIECLLSNDWLSAQNMAVQLDKLNKERREIQSDMHKQALTELETMDLDSPEQIPFGFCLFNETWHQGVIGILASKIKDKLHRPVITFARDKDGYIKGSARSIQGIHIRDVLDNIASQHPGIINKFGGHAMAAGLTLKETDLGRFVQLFNQIISELVVIEELGKYLLTDGELSNDELNFKLAESIINSGPWGQGFPEPKFDGEFNIVNCKIVGSDHLKLQLSPDGDDSPIDAIAFNMTDHAWPKSTRRVKTVYKLDINEYAGQRKLQLVLDYIAPL